MSQKKKKKKNTIIGETDYAEVLQPEATQHHVTAIKHEG